MRLSALLAALALSSGIARAEGLDRDTLLTDSPAVPEQGTVRVTGGAVGVSTADNPSNSGSLSGSIGWTPVKNLSGDVGAFMQVNGDGGPSARVRYQILSQSQFGLDLSSGMRFKTVGFHASACSACQRNGEVEFLVAAGRRFGRFELVLNGVFGVETGGGGGKDVEAKGFAGYRFGEAVRAGLDSRLQTEVSDAEKSSTKPPGARDYDLTAGPAVSWLIGRSLQVQALVGVAQPRRTAITTPVGVVSASLDF